MRSLTLQRIFISVYVTAASYCVLLALVGPAGIMAYGRLEARCAEMEKNLQSLSSANQGLQAELAALQTSPERQRSEAHSLGYLAEGEVCIILPQGAAPEASTGLEPGRILGLEKAQGLGDEALKLISLSLGLVSLIVSLAGDLRRAPLRRKSYFRVQNASRT